jgi:hypothetical protein
MSASDMPSGALAPQNPVCRFLDVWPAHLGTRIAFRFGEETLNCNRDLVMATFAPEFAQYWLDRHAGDADGENMDDSLDTPTQQAALIELAERVSAARSVV